MMTFIVRLYCIFLPIQKETRSLPRREFRGVLTYHSAGVFMTIKNQFNLTGFTRLYGYLFI